MSKTSQTLWSAGIALLVLTLVPFGPMLLLPLQYFNTHIHELGHALATIGSGGDVLYIRIFEDGSGETLSRGGWLGLIAPAGYLGATLFGGWLIFAGKKEDRARKALLGAAVLLGVGTLLWTRNVLGIATGIAYIAMLALASQKLKGNSIRFVVQFLGLHQCLASLQAVLTLYRLNSFGHAHNDAANMARATGVPGIIWAAMWCVISAVVVFLAFRASAKT